VHNPPAAVLAVALDPCQLSLKSGNPHLQLDENSPYHICENSPYHAPENSPYRTPENSPYHIREKSA
jgi:hypothetical protein